MFRALRCALLGTFSMLAATSTYAGEAELSLESRVGGDSNVLRRPTRPSSVRDSDSLVRAAFWEFTPQLKLSEDREPLKYKLRYRAVSENIVGRRRLSGWDHVANGEGTWRITPVDTIQFSGGHRNLRRLRVEPNSGSVTPEPLAARDSDRQRLRLSTASVAYSRSFDQRSSLRLGFDFQDIDFVPNSGNLTQLPVDSRAYTASISPSFMLDSKTRIGFGVTGRYRQNFGKRFEEFENPPNPPVSVPAGADTTVFSGDFSLQLRRDLSETSFISVSAGPSVLRTEVEAANRNPGVNAFDEDVDFSWFAQANYEKRWKQSTLAVSYSRFESASGGGGGTSIVDRASVSLSHRPAERVNLRLLFNWNQRQQLVDNPQLPDDDVTRYQAFVTARYRLTEHLYLTSQVEYRFQEQDRQPKDRKIDVVSGYVGLRYTFEPLTY